MRDHDDGVVVFMSQIFQQLNNFFPISDVKVAGGLIRQNHLRTRSQRARNSNALFFTTRDHIRETFINRVGQVDVPNIFLGNQCRFLGSLSKQFQWKTDILKAGHQWKKVKALVNHCHIFAAVLIQIHAIGGNAPVNHLTIRRYRQPSHQRKQGGFARTGFADNGIHFAFIKLGADLFDRVDRIVFVPILVTDVVKFEDGF